MDTQDRAAVDLLRALADRIERGEGCCVGLASKDSVEECSLTVVWAVHSDKTHQAAEEDTKPNRRPATPAQAVAAFRPGQPCPMCPQGLGTLVDVGDGEVACIACDFHPVAGDADL
jgi:hypothetical protein